jgi:hypothetical protein
MILEVSHEVDGVIETTVYQPADLVAAGILGCTKSSDKRRGRTAKRKARGFAKRHKDEGRFKQYKPAKPKSEYESAEIMIGPEHQAHVPPRGSYGPHEASLGGEVLWDPDRVFRGRTNEQVEGVRSLMRQYREFPDQMLMMECLAATDYVASDAQAEFDRKMAPRRSFELTDQEHEVFESMIQAKDFRAISKALGRSKGQLLTYYYHWKGRDRKAYKAAMSRRKKRQSKCSACDDGGLLIVCEQCRNAYHPACVAPPLNEVPKGEWHCHRCERTSPALERPPSLKGARLSTSPRKRLRSTQKEFTYQPKPKGGTAEVATPHPDAEEVESFASAVESLASNSSLPQAASINDASSDGALSEAGHDNRSDNNRSPSSSMSSFPAVPVKSKKRVSTHSDESYHESGDEGCVAGDAGDDIYLTLGTEDRAKARRRLFTKSACTGKIQGKAAGERADHFSPNCSHLYQVLVPFKTDGTLGLVVACESSTERKFLTGYNPEPSKGRASGLDGITCLASGCNELILKVDDEDTSNMTWEDFLRRLIRRSEGQSFKKLLMVHVNRHPKSFALPYLETGNDRIRLPSTSPAIEAAAYDTHRPDSPSGQEASDRKMHKSPLCHTVAFPELDQPRASTRLKETVPVLSVDPISRSPSEPQPLIQPVTGP